MNLRVVDWSVLEVMRMSVTRFVDVGGNLPGVSLPDLEGNPIALSSFAGRKLIVFMWASW
jgi:hypothetical protein